MKVFLILGRFFLEFIEEIGGVSLLLWRVIQQGHRIFRNIRNTFVQMETIGIGSIPLVLVTSVFVGAVTSVQAAYQFQGYVPLRYLGAVVGKSVTLEVGPVLTALVVGGRVSAAIAAELGTMKVTEQLDAMNIMAIDPARYLAMPRFLAAVLMMPIITILCDAIAVFGGYVASVLTLDVTSSTFIEGLKMFYKSSDLLGGLIKTFIFGGIIAMSGIFFGFNTEGGAEGVGKSTMTAVVGSCLSVLVADYVLAIILFQIVFGN